MNAKNFLFLLLINLILGLLQVNVFPEIVGNFLYVNFIFSLGFALLLLDRTQDAYMSILLGGLIVDLLGVDIIGLSTFVMMLLLVLTFYISRFFFRGRAFKMLLIFTSNVIFNFFVLQPHFSFNGQLFVSGTLNLIVVFITYLVLQMFQLKHDRYKI